jgi:hypothetical protein
MRTVAGVTLELFQRMLRAEVGVGMHHRTVGLNIDFRRDLWSIL